MSKQYAAIISVVYIALAGFIVYRGYERHDRTLYFFAAILVAAAIARLMRAQRATQRQVTPPENKEKVDLFTKPKDM